MYFLDTVSTGIVRASTIFGMLSLWGPLVQQCMSEAYEIEDENNNLSGLGMNTQDEELMPGTSTDTRPDIDTLYMSVLLIFVIFA